jgi:FtsP/CotA-like multicopper oxidase with cupredoxin domain
MGELRPTSHSRKNPGKPLKTPLVTPLPLSRRRFVSGALAACFGASAHGHTPAPAQPQLLRVTKSGFDGKVPGPELRVTRGEDVWVRVVNELDEPTAIHWHGVRLGNAMDGAPPLTQTPIAPGASFDYRFVAPDAGTFWYHPPQQTNARLYGALVVVEQEPLDVDHELTLIFTGAATGNDNTFIVNGMDDATLSAAAHERVRLRLLNVTASRILRLRVADLRVFVMATDGQPAQPFAARDGQLTLGPGNRVDVFIDWPSAPEASALMTIEGTNASATPIAKLVSQAGAAGRITRRDDPKPLPTNPLPQRMDFRDAFKLETTVGQVRAAKDGAALFSVRRGRTVTLGISNPASENAFIHLHGHSFRLLDALDDGWKPFWLDTMPIAPQGKSRIAFVADNPGKWLIEGLDGGKAWFEVT